MQLQQQAKDTEILKIFELGLLEPFGWEVKCHQDSKRRRCLWLKALWVTVTWIGIYKGKNINNYKNMPVSVKTAQDCVKLFMKLIIFCDRGEEREVCTWALGRATAAPRWKNTIHLSGTCASSWTPQILRWCDRLNVGHFRQYIWEIYQWKPCSIRGQVQLVLAAKGGLKVS